MPIARVELPWLVAVRVRGLEDHLRRAEGGARVVVRKVAPGESHLAALLEPTE